MSTGNDHKWPGGFFIDQILGHIGKFILHAAEVRAKPELSMGDGLFMVNQVSHTRAAFLPSIAAAMERDARQRPRKGKFAGARRGGVYSQKGITRDALRRA